MAARQRFGPRFGAHYTIAEDRVTISRSPLWPVGPALLIAGVAMCAIAVIVPGDPRLLVVCGIVAAVAGLHRMSNTQLLWTGAITATPDGLQWGRTHYRAAKIVKIDEDCSMWRDGAVSTTRWIVVVTLSHGDPLRIRLAPEGVLERPEATDAREAVGTAMHEIVWRGRAAPRVRTLSAQDGDAAVLAVKDGFVYRVHCADRAHQLVLEQWREGAVARSEPLDLGACAPAAVHLFRHGGDLRVVVDLVHPDHRTRPERWLFDLDTGEPSLSPRDRRLK